MNQITHLSAFASGILQKSSIGIIHSAYRKTINLSIHGQLLALQTAGSSLSPISLITDLDQNQMHALALQYPAKLDIYSVFSSEQAFVINLQLGRSSNASVSESIKKVLSMTPPIGFVPIFTGDHLSDPVLIHARNLISECLHLYHPSAYPKSAAALVRLIGLGSGLTPSGDDFLCGVLAGLILNDMWQHPFSLCLREQIAAHLTDTNDISQAFLKCALQRQFSLPVCHLAANDQLSEEAPKSDTSDRMFHDFSSIGHSSGMDTLCGIYFSLSL